MRISLISVVLFCSFTVYAGPVNQSKKVTFSKDIESVMIIEDPENFEGSETIIRDFIAPKKNASRRVFTPKSPTSKITMALAQVKKIELKANEIEVLKNRQKHLDQVIRYADYLKTLPTSSIKKIKEQDASVMDELPHQAGRPANFQELRDLFLAYNQEVVRIQTQEKNRLYDQLEQWPVIQSQSSIEEKMEFVKVNNLAKKLNQFLLRTFSKMPPEKIADLRGLEKILFDLSKTGITQEIWNQLRFDSKNFLLSSFLHEEGRSLIVAEFQKIIPEFSVRDPHLTSTPTKGSQNGNIRQLPRI